MVDFKKHLKNKAKTDSPPKLDELRVVQSNTQPTGYDIALPDVELPLGDGRRRLDLSVWAPRIAKDEALRVTVEGELIIDGALGEVVASSIDVFNNPDLMAIPKEPIPISYGRFLLVEKWTPKVEAGAITRIEFVAYIMRRK